MKAKGAKRVAKLIADAIPENVPELAKYLKGDETFTDIQGHWAENVIKTLAENGKVSGVGVFEDGNGFVWYSRSRIS